MRNRTDTGSHCTPGLDGLLTASAHAHEIAKEPARDAVHKTVDALISLGRWLRDSGYRFIAVTPATHARVLARAPQTPARSLEDVFGWSRPFEPALLPPRATSALDAAQALERSGGLWRSRIRFSSVDDDLYVHSAYPTTAADAVFFGPDTYRFAAFIRAAIEHRPAVASPARIVDIGCGTGAGGVAAARALGSVSMLALTDINPTALLYARANCALARIDAAYLHGDLYAPLAQLEPPARSAVDLIVANPPYLADPLARTYRDGGGALGSELSLRIVREGLDLLAPGGQLLLYTGSPIDDGRDRLRDAISAVAQAQGCRCDVREIDPDVFGEELDAPAYARIDRIAILGVTLTRPARPDTSAH